jgi:hypothetical protein
VNLVLGTIIVIAVTAVAVAAMLLVRRSAPAGSRFQDGDRASGVFGVLATGFSVLLGFIIFLAFESYDDARIGAETEATIVAQQVETARYLPTDTADQLTGQLICYARSVVGTEWSAVEDGRLGNELNPWSGAMFMTTNAFTPQSDTEQSAYDRWMDQTSQRQQARVDRVHGAEGIIPTPLWIVLFGIALVIFAYMLFFADSAVGPGTQAVLMGSVAVVMSSLFLLLVFFDNPHSGIGKLEPTAMERTLDQIDRELAVVGVDLTPPCDADGTAD